MPSRRIIRKYLNRRLYDTVDSRYIKRNELKELLAAGIDVAVVAYPSGEDVTREELLTLVEIAERSDSPVLSTAFLRALIRCAASDQRAELGSFLQQRLEEIVSANGSGPTGNPTLRR